MSGYKCFCAVYLFVHSDFRWDSEALHYWADAAIWGYMGENSSLTITILKHPHHYFDTWLIYDFNGVGTVTFTTDEYTNTFDPLPPPSFITLVYQLDFDTKHGWDQKSFDPPSHHFLGDIYTKFPVLSMVLRTILGQI